jgi:hypothetical protein
VVALIIESSSSVFTVILVFGAFPSLHRRLNTSKSLSPLHSIENFFEQKNGSTRPFEGRLGIPEKLLEGLTRVAQPKGRCKSFLFE